MSITPAGDTAREGARVEIAAALDVDAIRYRRAVERATGTRPIVFTRLAWSSVALADVTGAATWYVESWVLSGIAVLEIGLGFVLARLAQYASIAHVAVEDRARGSAVAVADVNCGVSLTGASNRPRHRLAAS